MDPRILKLNLKTSLTAVADLALPRVCIVCGTTLLLKEKHICTECLLDLPETHFSTLSRNPMADRLNEHMSTLPERYAYATALYYYDEDAGYKSISQALKYRRNIRCGKIFARLLGERIAVSPLFRDVDCVIPVPLHWTRYRRRGYNQSEVIAKQVCEICGFPLMTGILRRTKRTSPQTFMSMPEKETNVSSAFTVKNQASESRFTHILLIDDVFTTGATTYACFSALRKIFGPEVRISVAVLGFVKSA